MQLFDDSSDSHILEVTQVTVKATQKDSPMHGAASKRRRIELGWGVLRDRLQPQHSDFDVIPWYEDLNTLSGVTTASHLPPHTPSPLFSSFYTY